MEYYLLSPYSFQYAAAQATWAVADVEAVMVQASEEDITNPYKRV